MRSVTEGVHHITLRVTDLERSRAFYSGVLGLVADQDWPGKLRYRLGASTRLVLHPPLPGTPVADRVPNEGVQYDALGSAVLTFRDPDNIAWELFETSRK